MASSSEPQASSKKDDRTQQSSNNNNSSNSNNTEDPNFDMNSPSWFYIDSNGARQGPFSFKEMYTWWRSSFFPQDLMVKSVWDHDFRLLIHVPEFYNINPKIAEKLEGEREDILKSRSYATSYSTAASYATSIAPTDYALSSSALPDPAPAAAGDDYTVVGSFSSLSGKFQARDTDSHFASKGLPSDRALRMMSHYFDYDKYQEQMNAAKAAGVKKKKVKGTKEFWKKRKDAKKHKKMLAEYLKE